MKEEKAKTIILGAPKHFGIDKMLERELLNQGFFVINISFFDNKFEYKNLLEWLEIKWDKRKHSKADVLFKRNQEKIANQLAKIQGKADYALIIRPDSFPSFFLETTLKEKAETILAYQWDTLSRFPKINQYLSLFDRFFIFDPQDRNTASTSEATNFYPVSYSHLNRSDYQTEAYYWGNYSSGRKEMLSILIQHFKEQSISHSIHLYKRHKWSLFKKNMLISPESITFEENLQRSYNAKVLIDMAPAGQHGLSFRVFEAIGFEKKLITNNPSIAQYDFYHPNNIFIYGKDDIEALKQFVDEPYFPIKKEIKEKYSFRNWIQYILDIPPFEKLNFPK